jgi:hypothetical protein
MAHNEPQERTTFFFHMSAMHPSNQDGAVMLIMFRRVQHTALVHRRHSTFINPIIRPDQNEFDQLRQVWQRQHGVAACRQEGAVRTMPAHPGQP